MHVAVNNRLDCATLLLKIHTEDLLHSIFLCSEILVVVGPSQTSNEIKHIFMY